LGGGTTVIPFDTPQSVALFGHSGMKRDDDDFFAAFILNAILGGAGFESRLMDEVREKRGLTYGIRSYLVPKFHAEMWIGQVASSNDTIAEAIAVTRDVWADLATNGITAEELAVTKTFLTGEYPLRFDGNAEIAGIMVGMQMIGLSPDYVVNRNDFMNAVTLADVNRVAAEYLRPDDLHFVVVGQPVGLESTN
jgi:zinc protease